MGEQLSLKRLAAKLKSSYQTLIRIGVKPSGYESRYGGYDLYDLDDAAKRLEEFRSVQQLNRNTERMSNAEKGVTNRDKSNYTLSAELAEYLEPDYLKYAQMHRKASKTTHKCEVCGDYEIDMPILRNLCCECWSGLLLYFMSFVKNDDKLQDEKEDPLVFALKMARQLEEKGMPAFTHAAKLANQERIGICEGKNSKRRRKPTCQG